MRENAPDIMAVFSFGVDGLRSRALVICRYAWPLPYTMLGIAIGLLAGGRFQCVGGVVEIYGHRIAQLLRWIPIHPIALTLGHVVFGQDEMALQRTRTHERVHVRQYERWGIAFVPAYLAESAWLYGRGRDGYRENRFEIEAYSSETE